METQVGITLNGKPFGFDAISWSEDGMLSICTDSSIHVVTPLITTTFSDLDNYETGAIVLDLLPENAEFGESSVIDKPLQSSYSMQEMYRCAQWSPTGLSRKHGCLLTVMTTKHRVLLFEPDNGSSNWILCTDMTDLLKKDALQDSTTDGFDSLDHINRFHSLYMVWSPILHVNPTTLNPALLAIANKAGGISLWSYSVEHGIQHQISFQPHTSFLNLMYWSKWRKRTGYYVGYLLSSSTDGTVILTSVKVNCDQKSITFIETQTLHKWFEEDNSGMATVIRLWDGSADTLKIFIAKQLVVYSLILTIQDDIQLTPEGSWMDFIIPNSAVGVTGAYFASGGNQLRLFTFEGDGLVMVYQDGTWKFDDPLSVEMTKKLQLKYRQRWMEETLKYEEEDILNGMDMIPQIWGATLTPHGLYSAVLFIIKPVVDIHTYNESRDSTNLAFLVHPQIDGVNATSNILDKLKSYIKDPDFFFIYPVRSILHELLEFLLDEENNEQFMILLNTLNDLMEVSDTTESRWDTSNLKRQVYSKPKIIAACILLYINTELKLYKLQDDARRLLFELYNKCRHYVTCNLFQSILSYINDQDDNQWNLMTDNDIAQILIWCDGFLSEVIGLQEMLPVSSMLQPVKTTYQKLQQHCASSPRLMNISASMAIVESAINGNTVMNMNIESRQNCPAYTFCVCSAGHVFSRCGVTLQPITSPTYQSCIKCDSMRLPSSSNGLDQQRPPSLISLSDAVLSNCWMCIYCGSDMETKKIL
ncbi:transcription factor IIIC subunit delta N-term-domain-containing protein [Chlamydoabsidia padenii]|nr:transcription factor IIIC subunit delta N-term-domain-containing protein [Chlamydoabsidia padenii]